VLQSLTEVQTTEFLPLFSLAEPNARNRLGVSLRQTEGPEKVFAVVFAELFSADGNRDLLFSVQVVVEQLPVLPPRELEAQAPWSRGQTVNEWMEPRVLELTYTAVDMAGFAATLGNDGAPFRWEPERRRQLRAELDAACFHLYGLDRTEVEYVMETFPIVRRNDEATHGEYLTKRLILERYDELA
jgi:hypothetical protein